RLLEPRRPVAGLEHLHPLRFEVHAAEEADRSLVVDHQDPGHTPFRSRSRLYPVTCRFIRARSAPAGPPAAARTRTSSPRLPATAPRSGRASLRAAPWR